MYTRLTKIVTVDGQECVACAAYGTETCHIHSGAGCMKCPMLAAILNQLNFFEEAYCEKEDVVE